MIPYHLTHRIVERSRSNVIFQVKGEPKLIPHPSEKGTVLKVILEQM